MSLIAAHRVQSPTLAMAETLAASDVQLSLERTTATSTDRSRLHFWANGADLDAFETNLRADDTVADFVRLDEVTDERLYSAAVDTTATLSAVDEEFDAISLSVQYTDGWWHTESRFPDEDSLDRYRTWLTDRDADIEVENVYVEDVSDRGPNLTRRQRETVLLAYEEGFFEVPRQATLTDLAVEFDVSEQAISQRLRRAYSRLVAGSYGK
ncbi:helix-turn-helix domain-containing protein [Halomarina oriensis]|uniref:Helix-turn-helix domain-containing protein n=1 Tax=Halomarina oriensis TaxID=671145 RepID=A0A6B0GKU7_9EURY|nr:helix-turn-helix domain-containing protein [Halomarina oriensis]MWG35492.1 helix-turn-helix domain-containing protein [Halomarina oriensis]